MACGGVVDVTVEVDVVQDGGACEGDTDHWGWCRGATVGEGIEWEVVFVLQNDVAIDEEGELLIDVTEFEVGFSVGGERGVWDDVESLGDVGFGVGGCEDGVALVCEGGCEDEGFCIQVR